MRNIAKCKLCQSVIESFHSSDTVFCKCGEIGVYGGTAMRVIASDFNNLLRIDDQGNEIVVIVQDTDDYADDTVSRNFQPTDTKPNKADMLNMLDEMAKNIEKLPQHVLLEPITHSDFCSLILLLSSILRAS